MTGTTGAGKSYLANALCVAAIRQFKTVKYIRANTMMSEMDQARIKEPIWSMLITWLV
nr:ATP-binding protein [[Clostridium] scindens]